MTEWIKFAGSDVYHLPLPLSRYRIFPPPATVERWTACGDVNEVAVKFVGTPEPLCPRCLAISQQQEEVVR